MAIYILNQKIHLVKISVLCGTTNFRISRILFSIFRKILEFLMFEILESSNFRIF